MTDQTDWFQKSLNSLSLNGKAERTQEAYTRALRMRVHRLLPQRSPRGRNRRGLARRQTTQHPVGSRAFDRALASRGSRSPSSSVTGTTLTAPAVNVH